RNPGDNRVRSNDAAVCVTRTGFFTAWRLLFSQAVPEPDARAAADGAPDHRREREHAGTPERRDVATDGGADEEADPDQPRALHQRPLPRFPAAWSSAKTRAPVSGTSSTSTPHGASASSTALAMAAAVGMIPVPAVARANLRPIRR